MTSPRRSLQTPRWRGKELKCVEYLPGAKLFTNGCSRTARDNTQELLFAPFSKGRARLRGRSNLLKPHVKLFLLLQSMTSTKQGQVLPPAPRCSIPWFCVRAFSFFQQMTYNPAVYTGPPTLPSPSWCLHTPAHRTGLLTLLHGGAGRERRRRGEEGNGEEGKRRRRDRNRGKG